MSSIITYVHRSYILKMALLAFSVIMTALIDHAMLTIFDWSFLLTWQLLALVFLVHPTIPALLLTILGLIFDTLGGMIVGYTAFLLIVLQLQALFFQYLFSSISPLARSIFMAVLLLMIAVPEWALSCIVVRDWLSPATGFLMRLPCALSFPFIYFIVRRTFYIIINYESVQS